MIPQLLALALTLGVPAPATTVDFAVIGDLPYSTKDLHKLPGWVDDINVDTDLDAVVHVGDIKSGDTPCDDATYTRIRDEFARFRAPLAYTPGDNEWADCHHKKAGRREPLERLGALRRTFFFDTTNTQPGYPENTYRRLSHAGLATIHVVGSNNDAAPWKGLDKKKETKDQRREREARTAAGIAWIKDAFDQARSHGDKTVVLAWHADMFAPDEKPSDDEYSSYGPFVKALAEQARAFNGHVLLFDGDSHTFNVDQPLAKKSPFTKYYGLTPDVTNLTRITVNGEDDAKQGWIKVSVADNGTFTWQRMPYTKR